MDGHPTDITAFLEESGYVPTRWLPDESGWIPNGPCVTFRPDGRLHVEITYVRGVAHGPYRDYWPNGFVSLEGQYVNGLKEGEWRFYHWDDGSLREVLHFVAGREIIDWDAFFGRTPASDSE